MSHKNRRRIRADYAQAKRDLEATVVLLSRATGRMDYLLDYLDTNGIGTGEQVWMAVADALTQTVALLEDGSLKDARKAARNRRAR